MFMITKQNLVLVIQAACGRAAQLTSPYTDRHGETDSGLRRGVPLKLHQERAKDLILSWFSGGFDHDTEALGHTWNRRTTAL